MLRTENLATSSQALYLSNGGQIINQFVCVSANESVTQKGRNLPPIFTKLAIMVVSHEM